MPCVTTIIHTYCTNYEDNNAVDASSVTSKDFQVTNKGTPVVTVEPISGECGQSSFNGEQESGGACCTDTWVKVCDISLTFEDKRILEQGEKLIDST